MKVTRARIFLVCSIAAAGLILCLCLERSRRVRADEANKALRLQLEQTEALLADNRRLLASLSTESSKLSQSHDESGGVSAMNEPAKELLRLRGEVAALRRQSQGIETLRENTRQTRAALETPAHNPGLNRTRELANGQAGSQLEIVRAVYWTDNAQLDVTDELRDRLRGDSLKAMASNNLKGDPEFGQTKRLTIEYRYAGVTLTNEFREGAVVILPPE